MGIRACLLSVCLLFMVSAFPAALAQDLPLDSQVISDLDETVKTLVQKKPPSEYYYLFIGRSLTPLEAWIKNQYGEGACSSLPFSRLTEEPMRLEFMKEEIQDEFSRLKKKGAWPVIADFFAGYLPRKKVLGKRKLLLLDFTDSGGSLVGAEFYVSKTLKAKRLAIPFEAMGFSNTESSIPSLVEEGRRIPTLPLPKKLHKMLLEDQSFKEWSSVGIFKRRVYHGQADYDPPDPDSALLFRRELEKKMKELPVSSCPTSFRLLRSPKE